jgi:hypothetical protein
MFATIIKKKAKPWTISEDIHILAHLIKGKERKLLASQLNRSYSSLKYRICTVIQPLICLKSSQTGIPLESTLRLLLNVLEDLEQSRHANAKTHLSNLSGNWTKSEDERLLKAVSQIGPDWNLMQHIDLPGRSARQISRRYEQLQKGPTMRNSRGSEKKLNDHEWQLLSEGVTKYGISFLKTNKYKQIPNRSRELLFTSWAAGEPRNQKNAIWTQERDEMIKNGFFFRPSELKDIPLTTLRARRHVLMQRENAEHLPSAYLKRRMNVILKSTSL